MTRDGRIGKLERALQPEEPPVRFELCQAPAGLTPAEHDAYHARAGSSCFTLDLGDCDVRGDA
jgi:hypothetical protein